MEAMLLAVGLKPEKEMRLSMLCLSQGIAFRPVREKEYGLPLAALCGENLPGIKAGKPLPVEGEMLVMAGFSDAQIDGFLKTLRESGIAPLALKAVLTDTNRFWTCGQLYRQLRLEHLAFGGK